MEPTFIQWAMGLVERKLAEYGFAPPPTEHAPEVAKRDEGDASPAPPSTRAE